VRSPFPESICPQDRIFVGGVFKMQTPSTSKMLLDLIPVLACFIAMSGAFILVAEYNPEIRETFYGLSDHSGVLPYRAEVENHTVATAAIPQAASQDTDLAADDAAVQYGSAEVQASAVPVTPPPAIANWGQNGEGTIKPKLFGEDQSLTNKSIDPQLTRRSLTRVLIPPARSATTIGQKRTKLPPSTARARATFSHLGRGRQFSKPRQHKQYVSARSRTYATIWNWSEPPAGPARLPGPNPRSPNGNDSFTKTSFL
jgi:hypothetical protein